MFIITVAFTVTRDALLVNLSITAKVSAVAVLLLAGLYVSSMSSCLGAMYGTPRVLQSIANERVIPGLDILGRGVSKVLLLLINYNYKILMKTDAKIESKYICTNLIQFLQLSPTCLTKFQNGMSDFKLVISSAYLLSNPLKGRRYIVNDALNGRIRKTFYQKIKLPKNLKSKR